MPHFFFQAEDGIRDFCLSRGLGDVYKRQHHNLALRVAEITILSHVGLQPLPAIASVNLFVGSNHLELGKVFTFKDNLHLGDMPILVSVVDKRVPLRLFVKLCKGVLEEAIYLLQEGSLIIARLQGKTETLRFGWIAARQEGWPLIFSRNVKAKRSLEEPLRREVAAQLLSPKERQHQLAVAGAVLAIVLENELTQVKLLEACLLYTSDAADE